MKREKKSPNPLIGVLFLLTLAVFFLIGNWNKLFNENISIEAHHATTQSQEFFSNTDTDNNTVTTVVNGTVKILIAKWGFETVLLTVTVLSSLLTMFLLAKLGLEGKWVVRGGTVVANISAVYVGRTQPISLLLITPMAIVLTLAAFGFSFDVGGKTEIATDGTRNNTRYRRGKFN